MDYGPGVVVGPAFMVVGLLILAFRRPLGLQWGRIRPDAELAGTAGVAVLGVTTVFAGTLGLLAGLHWLDWWPL